MQLGLQACASTPTLKMDKTVTSLHKEEVTGPMRMESALKRGQGHCVCGMALLSRNSEPAQWVTQEEVEQQRRHLKIGAGHGAAHL
jgi:hypothetical protein